MLSRVSNVKCQLSVSCIEAQRPDEFSAPVEDARAREREMKQVLNAGCDALSSSIKPDSAKLLINTRDTSNKGKSAVTVEGGWLGGVGGKGCARARATAASFLTTAKFRARLAARGRRE